MSHSPSNDRTLHYVEVLYMKGIQFIERKFNHYPEEEAGKIYQRTINKFTEDKSQNVIICLREENHNLLKSHRSF